MGFGQGFVAMGSLRSGRLHSVVMMLALSFVTMGGSTSTFAAESPKEPGRQAESVAALPDPALVQRQPAPACGFRGPVSNPITAEEARQKLDYEQQCYRASESIVRGRLEQLQDYVQKMTKNLPDPALLQRQPEPACGFRGPVSNPMTAEETRQKLDYEQQCYQASESIARGRLEQLQDYVQKMIRSRKTTVTSRSNKEFRCSTPIGQLLMFFEGTESRCSTGATMNVNVNGIR
jgi:hypothetical protein